MPSLFDHHRKICWKCNFEAFGRAQIEREFLLPNKRAVNLRWARSCRKCRMNVKLETMRKEIAMIDAARDRLHEKRRLERESTHAVAGDQL